jgi:tetratricopeptide (TPR) repeat protein
MAAAASSTSGFVGRERELGELRRALDRAGSGHGRLFLLSGEPGIGKTRLAEEIAAEAAAKDMRVLWGRCWEGDGAPAYWPWIQVLRACLAEADAEQRTAILGVEATPRIAQDIAQLLPELHLAHLQSVKPRGPQPSDPEQARFLLFESVATVLRNVARIAPLLILIDDLHDADHPSLLMQRFIASQTKDARILMVGTYRDTEVRQSAELSKLIGDLTREGHLLPIPGLSEGEIGEFIESNSGEKADNKLVTDLYQATDGNPLFVDGVVRLLVAEGKVDRTRLDGTAFKIPDDVRESIRRRLAKLPDETSPILSTASVVGNDFETALLAKVSGNTAKQITAQMEDAIRAGIVIVGAAGGKRYQFSHALIREALYQDLALNRRTEFHCQIGSALEEVYYADLKPHLATLAHHFREGGIVDKAIDYSIAAGESAEAVFAYRDAISHLRPALALSEAHDDRNSARRAQVLLCLGRIQVFFGDRDAGVAHLETGLKIFEQLRDERHAGEIHLHLGRVFGPMGPHTNVARGLLHLRRAEVLFERTSEKDSLGMLNWGIARTSFEALQIDEAIVASQKAMDIFEQLGERELWGRVASNQAQYFMVKGKLARAVALLDQILVEAAGFENPDGFQHITWTSGLVRLLMRDPREATRFFRLGLTRPGRQLNLRALLLEFLTLSELLGGNLAEAKRLAAENIVNQTFRSQIAFSEGDWEAAGEMYQEALTWAQNAGSKWNELNTLTHMVELLRVTGDYDRAAAALERALNLYSPDDQFWEMRARPQAVLLSIDAGRPEKAEEHLKYCRGILAQQEDWLGRAGTIWRAEGIVAAAKNRFSESDPHFEKAIQNFKQYSLPWEEAETLHYWGRALFQARQLDRAHEKLDAAIKIYRDRGARQRWIDRVEADRPRAQPLRSGGDAANAESGNREAIFHDEGDFWSIAYLGHSFRLKDMRGLHYIAYLLAHPNERFHVRDLAVLNEPPVEADRGDAALILDHRAKADYRARLSELRTELDEAERMNDSGRAERIREEIEFVNDELSAALGLGGRDRKTSDDGERARLRIGKVIRSALNAIRERDPSLGLHFSACIRTGYYCAYIPDPRQLPSWKL